MVRPEITRRKDWVTVSCLCEAGAVGPCGSARINGSYSRSAHCHGRGFPL
jgi:hypothetical protein